MGNKKEILTHGGKLFSTSDLTISHGDIKLKSTDATNIAIGERSVDFFFDPNNFPLYCDGEKITISMCWGTEDDILTVERCGADSEVETIAVTNMTDYQRTIAFLYLIGKVMPDGN